MCDTEDFNIITVEIYILTFDAYHCIDESIISSNEFRRSIDITNYLLLYIHYLLLPTIWGNERTIIINLPNMLPKIKSFPIIEDQINDKVVINKMVSYHPISQEWLAVHSENCYANSTLKITTLAYFFLT